MFYKTLLIFSIASLVKSSGRGNGQTSSSNSSSGQPIRGLSNEVRDTLSPQPVPSGSIIPSTSVHAPMHYEGPPGYEQWRSRESVSQRPLPSTQVSPSRQSARHAVHPSRSHQSRRARTSREHHSSRAANPTAADPNSNNNSNICTPSSHVPMAHSVAAARRSPDPSAQVPAQTASSATHRIDDASSSRPPHESGVPSNRLPSPGLSEQLENLLKRRKVIENETMKIISGEHVEGQTSQSLQEEFVNSIFEEGRLRSAIKYSGTAGGKNFQFCITPLDSEHKRYTKWSERDLNKAEEMFNDNKPYSAIAKETKIPISTLQKHFSIMQRPTPPEGSEHIKFRKWSEDTWNKAREYKEAKMSVPEISQKTGIPVSTLRSRFVKERPDKSTVNTVAPSTAHSPQVLAPSTTHSPHVLAPSTAHGQQVLAPSMAHSQQVLTTSTANGQQVLAPSTAHSPQGLAPSTAHGQQVLAPSTTHSQQVLAPSTAHSPQVLAPSMARHSAHGSGQMLHPSASVVPQTPGTPFWTDSQIQATMRDLEDLEEVNSPLLPHSAGMRTHGSPSSILTPSQPLNNPISASFQRFMAHRRQNLASRRAKISRHSETARQPLASTSSAFNAVVAPSSHQILPPSGHLVQSAASGRSTATTIHPPSVPFSIARQVGHSARDEQFSHLDLGSTISYADQARIGLQEMQRERADLITAMQSVTGTQYVRTAESDWGLYAATTRVHDLERQINNLYEAEQSLNARAQMLVPQGTRSRTSQLDISIRHQGDGAGPSTAAGPSSLRLNVPSSFASRTTQQLSYGQSTRVDPSQMYNLPRGHHGTLHHLSADPSVIIPPSTLSSQTPEIPSTPWTPSALLVPQTPSTPWTPSSLLVPQTPSTPWTPSALSHQIGNNTMDFDDNTSSQLPHSNVHAPTSQHYQSERAFVPPGAQSGGRMSAAHTSGTSTHYAAPSSAHIAASQHGAYRNQTAGAAYQSAHQSSIRAPSEYNNTGGPSGHSAGRNPHSEGQ